MARDEKLTVKIVRQPSVMKTMEINKHVVAALVALRRLDTELRKFNSSRGQQVEKHKFIIIMSRMPIHFYLDFLSCIRVVFRNKIKYYLTLVCIYTLFFFQS